MAEMLRAGPASNVIPAPPTPTICDAAIDLRTPDNPRTRLWEPSWLRPARSNRVTGDIHSTPRRDRPWQRH